MKAPVQGAAPLAAVSHRAEHRVVATGPRSRREQSLFWITWALGPGIALVAQCFRNPSFGRIWTPDARPDTVDALEAIVPAGFALSALTTLALCILRGGLRRQPECWVLLLFWLLYATAFVTCAATGRVIGGDLLVPLTCLAGALSPCVAVVYLLQGRTATPEPTAEHEAGEPRV